MPLNIPREEASRVAEKPAARKRVSKTKTIELAWQNKLSRVEAAPVLWDRLKPLRETISVYPDTGLVADKAFFDELSGAD